MSNSVFVPGHITGFFTVEDHEISLKKGSCGVGFLLSKGVKTTISEADELTVDVNQGDSTVIDEVLKIFEIDACFKINQDIQLPIGAGFGTSAASALSLAIAINEFLDVYKNSPGKNLEKYLDIKGIYIPEFDNETKISLVENMDETYHITQPIISKSDDENHQSIFNNTIMLNVSRGCTRGCRFCMAGYLYRPTRETKWEKLIDIALDNRKNTGLNKVTLIGAAVSDYSDLDKLIDGLEKEGFQISTPSLRIESITKETLITLKKSGLKTITLAPESISRLRKVVNKEILEKQIFTVIKNAVELDFNIKLYFLIGIPGESNDDIHELCEYMKKIANMHKNPKRVKFSVNPLIPKPHTPLQWECYDFKDIKRKTRYIQKEMKNYNIKCESPKKGLIQYILSCGNRGISSIIEKSLEKQPTLKEWREITPKYDIDEKLPWSNIDVGIDERFLKIEHKRLRNLKQTPWCETSQCSNCGSCQKVLLEKD